MKAMKDHRLLEVVEAMPDGVVIVDSGGLIVLVNREMERLVGYSREQMLGQAVEMLIPFALREGHVANRDGFAAAPRRRSMGLGLDLAAQRQDGSSFPVEIALAPADLDGERVAIATVRDMTVSRATAAELQDSRQRVMLAEDHERIARDLHDTVIQRLFAAGLSLQSVIPIVPEQARAKIEAIIDNQDDAIRELRTAIFGMSSKRSAGLTIRVVVNQLVDDVARVLDFRPALHFVGVLDGIDAVITTEVAAVVREALTNVARHARARRADVTLRHVDDILTVTISDDGAGIPQSHQLGSGLLNMHDRAKRLGGSCTISSDDQSGTTVRLVIPVGP
ncbi:MAG: PAS domain S-box protein [Ilumatobacteraceae bacterium]